MKMSLARAVFLLLSAASLAPGLAQGQTAANPTFGLEHGTLGLAIMTKGGIVLAADSRSTFADNSYLDNAEKVFRLGDSSGCTIAGTVALKYDFFGRVMGYSMPKAIQDYRTRAPVAGSAPMQAQAEGLGRILEMDLIQGLILPAASPYRDGGTIATVIVAGYSQLGNRKVLEAYKLKLDAATEVNQMGTASLFPGDPTIVRRYWAPILDHAPFAIFTNGNDQVAQGILDMMPQSDASVRIPAIASYIDLRQTGKLNDMTIEEAIALADALIGESIRIAGRALGIGGQIDIAVITPDGAFRWQAGHDPASKTK